MHIHLLYMFSKLYPRYCKRKPCSTKTYFIIHDDVSQVWYLHIIQCEISHQIGNSIIISSSNQFSIIQLYLELRRVCLLAKAAISTNCPSLRQHVSVLLECVVPLFKSPLAAPHVVHVFVTLGNHVFVKKQLNLCMYFILSIDWAIV